MRVGTSDGWQDISENFQMDWQYDEATDGNIVIDEMHDLRTKFHWLPTPKTQILIPGGDLWHLSLEDTITSSEISGEITFEERG